MESRDSNRLPGFEENTDGNASLHQSLHPPTLNPPNRILVSIACGPESVLHAMRVDGVTVQIEVRLAVGRGRPALVAKAPFLDVAPAAIRARAAEVVQEAVAPVVVPGTRDGDDQF
jgi:hypothetical protein